MSCLGLSQRDKGGLLQEPSWQPWQSSVCVHVRECTLVLVLGTGASEGLAWLEERAQHRLGHVRCSLCSNPSTTASCVCSLLTCKWEYHVYGVGWLSGSHASLCLPCCKGTAALRNEFTFSLQDFAFFFTEAACLR